MHIKNINSYKCAVFDCDGVILDSNRIKTEAFRFALNKEPHELVEKFIHYHRENGGVSRYVKFLYYFNTLKKEKNPEHHANHAIKRYAAQVKSELMYCSLIPGVIEFLTIFNNLGIPCVINSGGDQEELREIFSHRGFDHFFLKILGSPATKKENLNLLLRSSILKTPSIFFGDALSDYLAAKEYNMDFVFISGCSEWNQGIEFCHRNQLYFDENFELLIQKDEGTCFFKKE